MPGRIIHPDCLDIGERVVVRCNGFRCLAYCDRDGIWRLQRNDEVLERIYIGRRFKNDTERLEKLFDLYTKMTSKEKVA